ncbi:MAG: hypothetical protein P1V34_09885 [Alphaproteobacteria bacterium]|nr:hypothetical protein [Alphaproteobacteria bacterium]
MPAQSFDEKSRERFRKIVGVMERATIDGERAAAREAAVRMAAMHGMTLEEAVDESHPERDDGRLSAAERKARRDDFDAWAAARNRMSEAQERADRYRYEQAKREAEARGLDKDTTTRRPPQPRRVNTFSRSYYRMTDDDRFRLVAGLLRDGASLKRAADLADVSTNEAARIWMLMRAESRARR